MVLGDLGPEMHEGILFFCTATHFAPPSIFWLGLFLVFLYGKFGWLMKFCFIFWLVEEERMGAPSP